MRTHDGLNETERKGTQAYTHVENIVLKKARNERNEQNISIIRAAACIPPAMALHFTYAIRKK